MAVTRRAAAAAATAAALALIALASVIVTSPRTERARLLSTVSPMLNGAPHIISTGLSYVSGPISAGPAGAHMDFGEPDAGVYLQDVSERGRDPSIVMKSPSSEHSEPYHGGVNRWREKRSTPSGSSYPTSWGTSEQDARPVAAGNEQGQAGNWGVGWGPNQHGVGKEGAPRALSAAEKKYWGKAAMAYDSALGHLYDAQDSADAADWVASEGFYPGLAPRAPEYADSAYAHVDHAASKFPPALTDPEWYPAGPQYAGMPEYYSSYWDRMPEPLQYEAGNYYPAAFEDAGYPSYPEDTTKPVNFNGQTYYY